MEQQQRPSQSAEHEAGRRLRRKAPARLKNGASSHPEEAQGVIGPGTSPATLLATQRLAGNAAVTQRLDTRSSPQVPSRMGEHAGDGGPAADAAKSFSRLAEQRLDLREGYAENDPAARCRPANRTRRRRRSRPRPLGGCRRTWPPRAKHLPNPFRRCPGVRNRRTRSRLTRSPRLSPLRPARAGHLRTPRPSPWTTPADPARPAAMRWPNSRARRPLPDSSRSARVSVNGSRRSASAPQRTSAGCRPSSRGRRPHSRVRYAARSSPAEALSRRS